MIGHLVGTAAFGTLLFVPEIIEGTIKTVETVTGAVSEIKDAATEVKLLASEIRQLVPKSV